MGMEQEVHFELGLEEQQTLVTEGARRWVQYHLGWWVVGLVVSGGCLESVCVGGWVFRV